MWNFILEFGLKLLGFFLDKATQDKAIKENFLKFIDSLEEKQLVSSKMRLSYKEQIERLKNDKPN